jgi:8-oxo-dGTP diphosphatase
MEQNPTTKLWESKYWHPAVAVDAVVFGYDDKDGLSVLLIERGGEPFKGCWALPGGFITQEDESAEAAVIRELGEETNMKGAYLKEFKVFSKKDRDPRERVISIAFYALVIKNQFIIKGGDDANKAEWHNINNLPQLAFDHLEIFTTALRYLQRKITDEPVVFHLLNKEFTMSELYKVYNAIIPCYTSNIINDRRNFSKKMLSLGYIKETDHILPGAGRPAKLYTLDEEGFYEERDRKIKMNL